MSRASVFCASCRLIQSKCRTAWSSARALSYLYLPLVNLLFQPRFFYTFFLSLFPIISSTASSTTYASSFSPDVLQSAARFFFLAAGVLIAADATCGISGMEIRSDFNGIQKFRNLTVEHREMQPYAEILVVLILYMQRSTKKLFKNYSQAT